MRVLALLLVILLPALLPRTARSAQRLVTVAMDVRGIEDASYRELGLLSLQRQLALRLTQTGFAVVGLHKEPQIRLAFRGVTKEGLTLEAALEAPPQKKLARRVPRGRGDLASFHLEVIHRAMSLVRQAEQALPPVASQSQPSSQPSSQPLSQPASQPASRPASRPRDMARLPVEPRSRPTPWGLELAGGGMGLYRPGGVDLLLRGSGRIGIFRGLGLRGAISVSPYLGSEDLTVVELGFQAGASWRFQLTRALHLEPGLFAGVLQHIHDEGGSTELEWDFLGSLALELGLRLHRYLGVRLWIAPGFASQGEHKTASVLERGAFRLEAGAVGVLILR